MDDKYELPPPQAYRGPAGAMDKGPWLKGDDIPEGRIVPVTIQGVAYRPAVKFTADGDPEEVWSLVLVGKKKEVKINTTIRKELVKRFGADTAQWFGKRIGLSSIEQQVGREVYRVLRVRDLPQVTEPANPRDALAPGEDNPLADPAPQTDGEKPDYSEIPFAWLISFALLSTTISTSFISYC